MNAASQDPMQRLIEALADDLVREYLTSEAAPGNDCEAARPNPGLPGLADAA